MPETSRWVVTLILASALALGPACTDDTPTPADAVAALDAAAEGGEPMDSGAAVDAPLARDAGLSDSAADAPPPGDERYVMLQNVKHTNGTFPVDLAVGPVTFEVDLDFKAATLDKTKLLSLDKSTGMVTALPLTSQGGSKARLTVTLAAGDPVLFKYATGAPFALGK